MITWLNLGDRVIMTDTHAWAGEVGTFVGDEFVIGFGYRPKIKLDNGVSCFVMSPGQVKVIENKSGDEPHSNPSGS